MKLYRFSPIKTKEGLLEAIRHIHFESYKLCQHSFGYYLPNAGNIGVFCHYNDEYDYLLGVRKQLTEVPDNFNQKYFKLHNPIVLPADGTVPETTYTHLYIRRPDPYRHHVGDIDFYLDQKKYAEVKQSIVQDNAVSGARVFERTDLDMIELYDPDSDVLAYVSTQTMTETVRVKQSDATKL